ncbi:tetratricopeptide repeat protein [Idiomarina aminovorans]|uniref:tetratricopeptide repeat protein n=1 Tax=Idiomarina aminovorans TaxID=2914829 RepID=UPI00200318C7|nr:tetratricopeptide repeat protein [Idiomarina sp. ATCH4]MCK7458282.1 tetratricopeptide repeat protein [Idiomarina sp. ATCH4]
MKASLTIAVLLLSLLNLGCSATVQERQTRTKSIESAVEWYKTGDLLSAEQHLQWLHSKGLGTDKSWKLLGNIYFRQYRFQASESAYRNSLKINESDESVWFNLALLNLRQTTNVLMDARAQLDNFDGELEMLLNKLLELQKARLKDTPVPSSDLVPIGS